MKPLRAEKSRNAPKGASGPSLIGTLGALAVGLVAGFPARKCAKNAVWPEFCSHCSHCSKRSGNALGPCLCGVPTVPTVPTQKSDRGKECTQSVKWSMHIIGRGVAAVFAVGRALWCRPYGVGGLRSIALPDFGNRQLNAVRTIGKTVRGGIPWGLMCGAGGGRGKFGAHMPETDRFGFFMRARVLGGGVYVPMYPHFSKRYPHLYPHLPPDSGTLRRTFAH